jgi:hypothetical protein
MTLEGEYGQGIIGEIRPMKFGALDVCWYYDSRASMVIYSHRPKETARRSYPGVFSLVDSQQRLDYLRASRWRVSVIY